MVVELDVGMYSVHRWGRSYGWTERRILFPQWARARGSGIYGILLFPASYERKSEASKFYSVAPFLCIVGICVVHAASLDLDYFHNKNTVSILT